MLIADRDGVGCIEITTLRSDHGLAGGPAALCELARSVAPENDWREASLAACAALYAESVGDGAALREWCLVRESLALYISYSCAPENRGLDDAAVDELLATLTLDPALS